MHPGEELYRVGGEPATALLNRAAAALYGVERSGRDTVHVAAAG